MTTPKNQTENLIFGGVFIDYQYKKIFKKVLFLL